MGEGDCTKSSTGKRIAGNVVEMQEASNPSLSLSSKRTKLASQELKLSSTSTVLEKDHFVVVSAEKTSTSSDFLSVLDEFSSSRCSSNDLHEIGSNIFKSADLEDVSFETQVSTCNNTFSLLSDVCGDSEETSMDSQSKKTLETHRRKPTVEVEKMPSMEEIEEFFSVSEKQEQKRFAEKYNYDIVKDVPLEGCYLWVRLKP